MKNVKKKSKKFLALLLTIISVMSTIVGCGGTEQTGPVVPTDKLLSAEYKRNKEITDFITYKYDYMTVPKSNGLEVAMLMNHMQIQVDEMETVTIGQDSMGEIVKIIDNANKYHVESNTQAVIDARQEAIDKEYEAAKKKAESKGKEYKKSKKQVRTDDIYFEEPYTYGVIFSSNTGAGLQEYKETLLVDSGKTNMLTLQINKYGIPYTSFEFKRVNGLYNSDIIQESDWIVNGVKATNVDAYKTVDENGQVVQGPTIVDSDSLNKAAKKNMFMSGNIAFGGEGFTWESLMLFCDALQLEEGKNGHGYKKSSDANFTYYTIEFVTNPFEFGKEFETNENGTLKNVIAPTTKLVATFDPLTQVCLNWTLDMYTTSSTFNGKVHTLTDGIDINVHEYKVDTNDYVGMRNKINKWIDSNILKTKTAYCAIDTENRKEPIAGIVNTGLTNVTISPVVNDVEYTCISAEKNEDGHIVGTYKSTVNPDEVHNWTIKCCILDESGNLLSEFIDENKELQINAIDYVVADFEKDDNGYKNIKLITTEQAEELLLLYAQTYQLNNDQVIEMRNLYEEENLVNARSYVNDLFKKAEAAQKNEETNDENDDSTTVKDDGEKKDNEKNPLESFKPDPHIKDLGVVKNNDIAFDVNQMTVSNLEEDGFEMKIGSVFIYGNDWIFVQGHHCEKNGVELGIEKQDDNEIKAFAINTDQFECYGGIKVGMPVEDALTSLNMESTNADEHIVVRSEDATMFVWMSDEEVVDKIIVLEKNYFGFNNDVVEETEEEGVKEEVDKNSEKEQNKNDDNTQNKQETSSGGTMIFAALIGILLSVFIFIIVILAMFKLFKKMDEPGWAAIVPLYNTWILCKHTWTTPILGMVGMLIPGLNFIFSIITIFKLCKKFDKGTLFCVLSIFFSPICLVILGLGKCEYYDE